MKTVEFNGQKFEVPEWARYITMDDYGEIVVWNVPPQRLERMYVAIYAPSSRSQIVGHMHQLTRYKEIR